MREVSRERVYTFTKISSRSQQQVGGEGGGGEKIQKLRLAA